MRTRIISVKSRSLDVYDIRLEITAPYVKSLSLSANFDKFASRAGFKQRFDVDVKAVGESEEVKTSDAYFAPRSEFENKKAFTGYFRKVVEAWKQSLIEK